MAKKKYIETPEILYELFEKYKSKIHENPRYQYQLDKTGKIVPIPLRVPFTMEGFRTFRIIIFMIRQKNNYDVHLKIFLKF